MSEPTETPPKPGIIGYIRCVWTVLWRPSARYSIAALLIVGGLAGVLFWGGFHWALELSNTESFCISCHEMRDTVYKELQGTIHFSNRSGVRATCPDCHVPKDWFYKVQRKIAATNELFHKVMGTIDTPEKFERHRLALATTVWDTMKASDSRECRNCHSAASMNPAKQSAAAKVMMSGLKAGLTCIDCHKGIAHKLPV
jgi:cytochrome c-type protein NapC